LRCGNRTAAQTGNGERINAGGRDCGIRHSECRERCAARQDETIDQKSVAVSNRNEYAIWSLLKQRDSDATDCTRANSDERRHRVARP
jgi:hypothetical protein